MGDNAEVLAGIPALDGAPTEVLAWLADKVEPVTFESGERLLVEGDQDRDCYLLVDGDVEVSRHGVFADTDHAGDITGELAMLYGKPRTATATALGPVRALRLRAADFDALATASPELASAAAETVIDYLRFRFDFQPPGPWTPP
jgi:CRP-like cAMP-binding protein